MQRTGVARLTAALSLSHPVLALAQQAQEPVPGWPGPWHWHVGWGFWIFPLFMLIMMFFCASRWFYFPRRRSHRGEHELWESGGPSDPSFSALRILNERFAKGEIEKQEYEEKKAALTAPEARFPPATQARIPRRSPRPRHVKPVDVGGDLDNVKPLLIVSCPAHGQRRYRLVPR